MNLTQAKQILQAPRFGDLQSIEALALIKEENERRAKVTEFGFIAREFLAAHIALDICKKRLAELKVTDAHRMAFVLLLRLRAHDWHYEKSDDGKAYERGRADWLEIGEIGKTFGEWGERAIKIAIEVHCAP